MKKIKGFTLIELLVVIAVISMLLAVIVPSLKLAKQKASAIICLTNAKNLSLGWFSYAEDNKSRIMSSLMSGTTDPYVANATTKNVPPWIKSPIRANGETPGSGDSPIYDEDEIRGIEAGALHPYLKAPKVFNCPSDKVKAVTDSIDPEKFVAYCIPDCLAGEQMIWESGDPAYAKHRIMRFNQITMPSERYNFVESAEQRSYIDKGHFVMGAPEIWKTSGTWSWWGPLAVNHGDASILGFCDGHAEIHKWHSKETKERVKRLEGSTMYGYRDADATRVTEDLLFMAKGWPYRYK